MRKSANVDTDVQPVGQANADSPPSADTVGASASNTVFASDPAPSRDRAGHDRLGRFARGNTAALKHGRFSMAVAKALLPEQREVLAMFADKEAALLVDLGGDENLSTLEKDLVIKYQRLDAIADYNAPRMLSSR